MSQLETDSTFFPLFLVNQVEHIFLKFNAQRDNRKDCEAMVSDVLEQYNARAERTGMKNFISTITNQDCNGNDNNSDSDENTGFSIVIQREVLIIITE